MIFVRAAANRQFDAHPTSHLRFDNDAPRSCSAAHAATASRLCSQRRRPRDDRWCNSYFAPCFTSGFVVYAELSSLCDTPLSTARDLLAFCEELPILRGVGVHWEPSVLRLRGRPLSLRSGRRHSHCDFQPAAVGPFRLRLRAAPAEQPGFFGRRVRMAAADRHR